MVEALQQSEPTIAAALRWLAQEFTALAALAERCEGRLSALRRERLLDSIDEARVTLASHRQAMVSVCEQARKQTPAQTTTDPAVAAERARAAGIDVERLRALHADGMCDPMIARSLGCERRQVFFWRRQLGLSSNYGGAQRRAARGGEVITADAGVETDA